MNYVKPLQLSGHYMWQQFNIHKLYVLPTQTVVMFSVWIWEQTAIIALTDWFL